MDVLYLYGNKLHDRECYKLANERVMKVQRCLAFSSVLLLGRHNSTTKNFDLNNNNVHPCHCSTGIMDFPLITVLMDSFA